MAWDGDLTEEQKNAAAQFDRHARLLAGPGTGKTRSLTRHAMFLIEEQRVEPKAIFVITFTRAATEELRNRFKAEFGNEAKLPTVSTLHSYALKMVLANSARVQLPSPIRIADDFEERHIIQEDLKELLKLEKIREVEDLLNRMSADWEQLTEDWESRFPDPKFLGAWQEHRKTFGYTLRSELVYQLKLALSEGQLKLKEPPKHLLVDEYQDLNACDLAVVKAIAEAGATLFTAGDDDQSIYGFRYADPEGIRRFTTEYRPCYGLELTECKRCDCGILELALFVARQDTRRLDKRIRTPEGTGRGEVQILHFDNQIEEAIGVAAICKWLCDDQKIRPGNILFLLRTDHNRQFSKPLRGALESKGFRVVTITDPLEPLNCPKQEDGKSQIHGRILVSLLRLCVERRDHLAWRTLLQLRSNGIGGQANLSLYNLARKQGCGYADALLAVRDNPSLIDKFGKKFSEEVNHIEGMLAESPKLSELEPLDFVRRLAEAHIPNEGIRKQVLEVFERAAASAPATDLSELLRIINISPSQQNQIDPDAINIMSMHQAKGLTADATFVIAAEEEYLPGRATGSGADDERRLLYVSLTRARHFLFITHCRERIKSQAHSGSTAGEKARHLSSFLHGGPVQSRDGREYSQNLARRATAARAGG
jgi:DNA helicase-2/ATP-dependent DNA helicase PcrA